MRIFTECVSCLFDQIDRAIRLLSPSTTDDIIISAQQRLMKIIVEKNLVKTKNHELSFEAYRIVAEILNVTDPFKKQKEKYNNIALDLLPQVNKQIHLSKHPVTTALKACILGNSIDFGAPLQINVGIELEDLEMNDLGGPTNIELFLESLKRSKNILILGDNAGEIVFDRIFIETILDYLPDKRISYSVRKGPIINDATLEDAKIAGITELCEVVESSATAGISMNESTPEFVEKFTSSDLILSKGQGNFESLVDIPSDWAEIYFLLKAKCTLMEKIFSVPGGTLLLVKKEKNLIDRINSGKFRFEIRC